MEVVLDSYELFNANSFDMLVALIFLEDEQGFIRTHLYLKDKTYKKKVELIKRYASQGKAEYLRGNIMYAYRLYLRLGLILKKIF